jgi:hypothetical protein
MPTMTAADASEALCVLTDTGAHSPATLALALRSVVLLRVVIDALPKCDDCGAIATRHGRPMEGYVCDDHTPTGLYQPNDYDLPHADAVRAMEKTR